MGAGKMATEFMESLRERSEAEFEDPEDRAWFKKVLIETFEEGYDAGQQDTLSDLGKFSTYMAASRVAGAHKNRENQERWATMSDAEKEGARRSAAAHKALMKKAGGG